ncbi:serine hydrolase [Phenylobacterium sp.]|uniref:serine hydrolase domain-containing protein n=1 Tax=Phenylobacterium sp. TaxID=1871053 RepID=UPI002731CC3D|nr:serine hydrolase domain-containing protein [Phenylobacterium sp.]MDP1616435.1 serine hydrolase domain-containing protein [Phenylobacterium sp.]MDP1986765.1 serine hydrolase domain-containing protein [Phenylobacterium sp.]
MFHFNRLAAATLAVAILAAPPAALAQRAPAPLPAAASPESVGFSAERLKRLDAAMARAVTDGRVAGMTTLLARHGQVVAFNTYGQASLAEQRPMEKDAIFRIYSMTKPVTGVAMMILFEEGRWRLDDPVSMYVPELAGLKVMTGTNAQGQPILEPVTRDPTMRELMSHTAGFGYGLAEEHAVDRMFREKRVLGSASLQEMVEKTATIPLMFQPGTDWSYSVAVDIQGHIVEKLTGQTLGAFMAERIFKPLKMTDTGFQVRQGQSDRLAAVYVGAPNGGRLFEATELAGAPAQDFNAPPRMESGGGGLVSTTADYARFAQMIANGGELDGVRILSPATVELMGTDMIPKDAVVSSNGSVGQRFNDAVGFGLDFAVIKDPRKAGGLEGKGTLSWGGAAGTWFWVDPTNDIVFVGMIQRFGGTGGPDLGTATRTLVYQALVDPAK